MKRDHISLEQRIALLEKKANHAPISLKSILEILSGKGRVLILILLSLPFCQPIMIPGLSTPFGIAIAFIGLRIALGQHIWLPKRFLAKKISPTTLKKITSKCVWLFKKLKRLVHPRLGWLCLPRAAQITYGLVAFLLGLLLALPLPIPFSNLAAAWALFFLGLGILEDDGLFVLIGYICFVLTVVMFIVIGLTLKSLI